MSALSKPAKKAIELEISDGSSVRQAVNALRQSGAVSISDDRLEEQLVLINNSYATLDDSIADGDEVLLLEVVGGG